MIVHRIHRGVAAGICLLACLAASDTAQAGMRRYELSGGLISGTLNGVAFTNASWTISAEADTADIQYQAGEYPVWYQIPTPTISIASGSSPLTANLTGDWSLQSRDYNAAIANYASIYFVNSVIPGEGFGAYISGENILSNLSTIATYSAGSGFNYARTYTTDVGNLFIASTSYNTGSFTVSPGAAVPEPSVNVLLGVAAGFAGFLGWRQRRAARAAA